MAIDTAPKRRRSGAALFAALGLLWGVFALANLGHTIGFFGSENLVLVVFLSALPTALLMLAAAGLWVGARWASAVAVLAVLVPIGLVGYVLIVVLSGGD